MSLARIESLKSGNAFLIVRGRTLPQFLSNSTRIHSNGNRNELCKSNLSKEKIFVKTIQFSVENGIDQKSNTITNENLDCSICMDRTRNSVIRSCNHFVTCYECAKLLFNRKDPCPLCRKRIDDVIRVYT